MTTSIPHRENTIPTPTISLPWARMGSPAVTARMWTLQTGTSSSRSEGSGVRGQGSGKPSRHSHLTPDPRPLTPAFTLIELLIVLVALVVLASAVVPALHNAGHEEDLAQVMDRVAASARFARDEAVARQVPIVLAVASAPAAVQLAVDGSGVMGSP